MFHLPDFDDDTKIDFDELRLLIKTGVIGLCELCLLNPPKYEDATAGPDVVNSTDFVDESENNEH